MSNIDYLIDRINRTIPGNILEKVFQKQNMHGYPITTTNSNIKTEVIYNWVLKDCNLTAGIETVINLQSANFTTVTGGVLVEVPLSATGGKFITSVLSTSYSYGSSDNSVSIADASIGPEAVGGVRLQLVGNNMVLIRGITTSSIMFLRCILENDEDFGNINQRNLRILGDICTEATKAYIYTKLVLEIDNSTMLNGVPLGSVSNIVESYADAYNIYNDMITNTWLKINMMGDRDSYNRYLRLIMPK